MRKWLLIILAVVVVSTIGLYLWWPPTWSSGTDLVRRVLRPEPTLRFAVVGDNHGDNSIYRQIISEVSAGEYQFLLTLGDNTEHGTTTEFAEVSALEKPLTIPVYHTLGSHDIKSDPSRVIFRQAFNSEPNMVIGLGEFRLVLLDNADRKVGFSDQTLSWLDAQLKSDPKTKYLLAYHRPFGLPLANVLGDDETPVSRRSNDRFLSIISPYHIVQIFTSHLHTYLPYTLNNIPAVVSGGGGDPAQSVLGGSKNNLFHFLDVRLTAGTIKITPQRIRQED